MEPTQRCRSSRAGCPISGQGDSGIHESPTGVPVSKPLAGLDAIGGKQVCTEPFGTTGYGFTLPSDVGSHARPMSNMAEQEEKNRLARSISLQPAFD